MKYRLLFSAIRQLISLVQNYYRLIPYQIAQVRDKEAFVVWRL